MVRPRWGRAGGGTSGRGRDRAVVRADSLGEVDQGLAAVGPGGYGGVVQEGWNLGVSETGPAERLSGCAPPVALAYQVSEIEGRLKKCCRRRRQSGAYGC